MVPYTACGRNSVVFLKWSVFIRCKAFHFKHTLLLQYVTLFSQQFTYCQICPVDHYHTVETMVNMHRETLPSFHTVSAEIPVISSHIFTFSSSMSTGWLPHILPSYIPRECSGAVQSGEQGGQGISLKWEIIHSRHKLQIEFCRGKISCYCTVSCTPVKHM